jgi:L-aspartate oxidase
MIEREVMKIEVLVVGTGIAGCSAALRAAEYGMKIILVTKDLDMKKSSTMLAQGGIIARGNGDTAELLVRDILEAGDGICDAQAVRILAEEGPKLVEEILIGKAGADFNRNADGFDYTKEAAHSVSRILHKDDRTGEEIENKIITTILADKNITLMRNMTLVDLIQDAGADGGRSDIKNRKCAGGRFLENDTAKIIDVYADSVILATGGLGQVYLHTTNPDVSTGDGLAAANRAGASITNAEYVQFHPTSLATGRRSDFLISESVRGEGAELLNEKGERFMQAYDERGSLAPRDVVARAIYEEIGKGGGGSVYLDMKSNMEAGFIKTRFPLIYETCLENGIDATKELIPVAPIAHYSCGGIRVDGWGRTDIENLYAAGEVSCTGLHGANRLASTSLLEGLVWGTRCAEDISRKKRTDVILADALLREEHGEMEIDPIKAKEYWQVMKKLMWEKVGIVRTEEGLAAAVRVLEGMSGGIEVEYISSKLTRESIELRSGVTAALLIARAARDNKESRGCHFRKNDTSTDKRNNIKIYGKIDHGDRKPAPREARCHTRA